MNNRYVIPVIKRSDLEEFKKTVKVGDRYYYDNPLKDDFGGEDKMDRRSKATRYKKVKVTKKYPFIVTVAYVGQADVKEKAMTYTELFMQKYKRAGKCDVDMC